MLTWAPREPSRNSRFANIGSPSLVNPAGSRFSIPSKKSARSRAAPAARRTSSPGSGGTKISGSNRVATTCAAWLTSAGRIPSSIRNTSESNRAPSCRARTCVTSP